MVSGSRRFSRRMTKGRLPFWWRQPDDRKTPWQFGLSQDALIDYNGRSAWSPAPRNKGVRHRSHDESVV